MGQLISGSFLDGVESERRRILQAIEQLEQVSHQTRTPLFQDTIFEKLKQALGGVQHPPRRFRDTANGE